MTLRPRSLAPAALLGAMSFAVSEMVCGCASPGPPRPPSLQLPALAKDVSALRHGNMVELRFLLPRATTDGVPLRTSRITVAACRGLAHSPCKAIAASRTFAVPQAGASAGAELIDTLPPELAAGPPRVLVYRIQLANDHGKDAGYSDPAYSAAGSPLPPVSGLQAQGSRLGVVLTWQNDVEDSSKVILRREDLNPAVSTPRTHEAKASGPVESKSPPKRRPPFGGPGTAQAFPANEPNVVLLSTGEESGAPQGPATLDTTALTDEPYRYSAERRRTLQLDGRAIELRSSMSAPVDFTLHDVFPPPVPTDLAVAGFADAKGLYSADLVWQPVDDPSLAGYNVYRETLDGASDAGGGKVKLNTNLVILPGYHDGTARAQDSYRYSVTAVDKKRNESAADIVTLSPQINTLSPQIK